MNAISKSSLERHNLAYEWQETAEAHEELKQSIRRSKEARKRNVIKKRKSAKL